MLSKDCVAIDIIRLSSKIEKLKKQKYLDTYVKFCLSSIGYNSETLQLLSIS